MAKIFVFGSNRLGIHKRGAAKDALNRYGAILGQGEGIQGQSYALPTKSTPWKSLTVDEIREHANTFVKYAKSHGDDEFLLTRVGCGLAGFTDEQMAPLFADSPVNVTIPIEWKGYIKNNNPVNDSQV